MDIGVDEINQYFVNMGHGSDIDTEELNYFLSNKRQNVEGFSFSLVTEEKVKKIMIMN